MPSDSPFLQVRDFYLTRYRPLYFVLGRIAKYALSARSSLAALATHGAVLT